MKTVLLQVWFGKIPDYFWFHYETTRNIKNFDFILFTDQELELDAQNYRVIKITFEDVENLISEKLKTNVSISNNKKICDLKASLGDVFYEYIQSYDYFGVYDIDTLFGDINKFVEPFIGEYDFISIADETYFNRLSGPFILFKNTKEVRELYRVENHFVECLKTDHVECFEETILHEYASKSFKVKLLYSTNISTEENGKNIFDCIWVDDKCFYGEKELMIYHFYHKNETNLIKSGRNIIASYNKKYVDDFYWVVHFTKNYQKFLPSLLRSIKKYSNRKCILYSINYFPDEEFLIQFKSEQFIFKEIMIPEGKLDPTGRDFNVLTSKPKILIDAINSFPGKYFVHIDVDIYFTTNSDDISKYIPIVEDYPLANSHIHDYILVGNLLPGEEWTNTLGILLREEKITNAHILPRRKCNIILFNDKCKWFFEEQMGLYEKYINSGIPGILHLHDEDTFNAVITKYGQTKALPLLDMEENYDLSLEKIHNYSYNLAPNTSQHTQLPKHLNDFYFFHGMKKIEEYELIKNNYGNTVLDNEEILVKYENNTILFTKNSFLTNKRIESKIDFVIENLNGDVIYVLSDQLIYNYFYFYLSNIHLDEGLYRIRILEHESRRNIYSNILKV